MCICSVSIKTDKGRINVPCGKCHECLQKRRADWTFRLLSELRSSESAYFITLTYTDENIPFYSLKYPNEIYRSEEESWKHDDAPQRISQLYKKDVQNFMKRLRKHQDRLKGKQLRYYTVGEYGEKTERPHYHMLLFNLKNALVVNLEEIWELGNIFIGDVTQASIHYVTKYMLQNQYTKGKEKPFSLMSTKPYLGNTYLKKEVIKYHKENQKHLVTYPDGIEKGLPKIYKTKLFSKITRQINAKEILKITDDEETIKMAKFNSRARGVNKGVNPYHTRIKERNKAKTEKMIKQSKSKTV